MLRGLVVFSKDLKASPVAVESPLTNLKNLVVSRKTTNPIVFILPQVLWVLWNKGMCVGLVKMPFRFECFDIVV
jgi:hypothetical protein